MEIIYHCLAGKYPFHQAFSQQAYVEYLVQVPEHRHAPSFKMVTTAIRQLKCPYLVRLVKVLRQQHQVHCLYEYYETSLEKFLLTHKPHPFQKIFLQLKEAINCLCQAGIKAKISIDNVGIDSEGNVKLFITPDVELLTKQQCQDHYLTELSRAKFDLEELCDIQESDGKFRVTNSKTEETTITLNSGEETEVKRPESSMPTKHLLTQIERLKKRSSKLRVNRTNSRLEEKEGRMWASPKDIGSKLSPKLISKENMKRSFDNNYFLKTRDSEGGGGSVTSMLQNWSKKRAKEQSEKKEEGSDPNMKKSYINIQSVKATRQAHQRASLPTSVDPPVESTQQPVLNIEMTPPRNDPQANQKVQISSETVSRYKVKIVSCHQIEFEGKQGEDLQKLAHDKFMEYKTQMSANPALIDPRSSWECSSDVRGSDLHLSEFDRAENTRVMARVMRAKEKASTALRQYAKNKKI